MTGKCDPCNVGSIDCAYCEHRQWRNPAHPGADEQPLPTIDFSAETSPLPSPVVLNLSPLAKQVGGSHYKGFKIQPIEFAAANGLNFLEGNVVKYTVRRKGDKAKRIEDLRKAIDNLEKLIHFVEQDICN